ncbi:MAG TPA: GTPase RsgA [Nocardioidaceae bacterium]|nr:GTPase RsgA [Nocardioidaceae bacterium]
MLETIGYDPERVGWAAPGDARPGRVARVDRGIALVLSEDGLLRASVGSHLINAMANDPTAGPCPGDFVLIRDWPDDRVTLEKVLPRRTAIVLAPSGERCAGKALCANVDFAAVVVSSHPRPTVSTIEPMLGVARESGGHPLVVLTKSDTVTDAHLIAQEVGLVAGVGVICTSTRTSAGLPRLLELIGGSQTIALLGPSGQGRSSLINSLAGASVLTTRVPTGSTTRVARRELVLLAGGGAAIDVPEPRTASWSTARRGMICDG